VSQPVLKTRWPYPVLLSIEKDAGNIVKNHIKMADKNKTTSKQEQIIKIKYNNRLLFLSGKITAKSNNQAPINDRPKAKITPAYAKIMLIALLACFKPVA
jgi:uncharacterized membrane protein YdfJ with MMPL/SSD domain